jgi:hypothetical protein
MPYPRFRRARAHKFATGTGGTATISSSAGTPTWTDLAVADLSIEAQTGDVLELSLSTFWVASTTTAARQTFSTMNGSTRINVYGNVAFGGANPWFVSQLQYDHVFFGQVYYTVQASDVISNVVTVRPMAAVDSGSRQVYGAHDWRAKNLGPVDPN